MQVYGRSMRQAAWTAAVVCLAGVGRFGGSAVHAQDKEAPTLGTIERLDPRFDRLVPQRRPGRAARRGLRLVRGAGLGPRTAGYLLFSDVPQNTVFQLEGGQGRQRLPQAERLHRLASRAAASRARTACSWTRRAGSSSASTATAASPGSRRTARSRPWPTATRASGSTAPTTRVFKSNGDLYFTDPPYGLLGLNDDPAKELDFNGVYRLSQPTARVTLLTKEMTFPNGIAFSPDEKTLYVANSDPEKAIWMAFPVKDDGTLGKGRVFVDATAVGAGRRRGCPTA